MRFERLIRLVLIAAPCFLEPGFAASTCDSLSSLKLPAATITAAQSVEPGAFTPPTGTAAPYKNLPAFCRVQGSSSRPPIRTSNSKCGCRFRLERQVIWALAMAVSRGRSAIRAWPTVGHHGYAAASTDTGHKGTGIDGAWALGHPEKIVDFGYRAIHETAEKSKAIIHAFYGEARSQSYFSCCSNGGRQALMEAQRYPADYDGIIAGAPANFLTHLLAGCVGHASHDADPASYFPASKMPAIESAALAACDSVDGVKDGVIDDPTKCHFDPSVLLCKGSETESCLTAAQVGALKKIHAGPRDSKGRQVMPGFSTGGESGPGGWGQWITGPAPGKSLQFAFGTQFFENMVYSNPGWDFRTFNLDRDLKTAEDKLAPVLNATDADVHRFRERGGKLILYHGWSDAAIPPVNAINYYQSVVAKMGAKNSEPFLRLYMVPGMQHCGGGPGRTISESTRSPPPMRSTVFRNRARTLGRKRRRAGQNRRNQIQRATPIRRAKRFAPVRCVLIRRQRDTKARAAPTTLQISPARPVSFQK